MFAGLHTVSELQLQRMWEVMADYEKWCKVSAISFRRNWLLTLKFQIVSTLYGKDFNFPKQHATSYIYYDITHKGATSNYTTRTGEGYQQESTENYYLTNFKNVEGQVSFEYSNCLNIIIH